MGSLNPKDLPPDRLSTTDEKGNRVYLYPAEVKGVFQKWRTRLHAFLIVFFLALPWIKIQGHPLLLLDIPHRRFAIFGLTFWAHDAPMLFFVFATLFLGLALLTCLLGRVWCGWACPQTVFIEGVFRRIERWVEGDSVSRKQRDEGPFSLQKLFKKSIKWFLFLLASLLLAHSFLAYFVGSDELLQMMRSSPSENFTPFLVMAISTGIVLFDFGWFREQFCVIACPYGRFQSVFMDSHSISVAYDEKRGEPRRGQSAEKEGDCINCYRCVQVCPTGIDIRRGLQLECVACTACIDACDEVMLKIERPKGLIRYDSISRLKNSKPIPWIRPRTLVYVLLLLGLLSAFAYTLSRRETLNAMLLRAKETPYQQIEENGKSLIINHFRINFSNESFHPIKINLDLAEGWKEKGIELITVSNPVLIEAGINTKTDFFIKFPKTLLMSQVNSIQILLRPEKEDSEFKIQRKDVTLMGPFQ
ncbi:MAG: cytochrome c oxidase accessory protein CcoG [Deltaproteobacteria bacterium]|nr:cytochrome c oxidase accessory protein CcoG [Deltaproteobacteria bacterium]